MPRLPMLSPEDLHQADRDVLQRPFDLWRVMANSPGTSRRFQALAGHLWNECAVERRTLELVILQVGYLARVPYEWVHHIRLGLANGLRPVDVDAIGAETRGAGSHLPPHEKIALRAAREMSGGSIGAATFERLSEHYAPHQIVDLVTTIALYCGVVRLLPSLGIEVEPEYAAVLQAYPLPTAADPPTA